MEMSALCAQMKKCQVLVPVHFVGSSFVGSSFNHLFIYISHFTFLISHLKINYYEDQMLDHR